MPEPGSGPARARRPRVSRTYSYFIVAGIALLAAVVGLVLVHRLLDAHPPELEQQLVDAEELRLIALWTAAALGLLAAGVIGHGLSFGRRQQSDESERQRQLAELERVNGQHAAALARLAILDAATRAAASAILITDREGFITWINPATVRLTGYGEEELLGTRFQERSRETPPAAELARADVWEGQVVSQRKDGRLIVEEQIIAPVRGLGGSIEHFVVIRRDVSRQRKAEDDLSAAHEELRRILASITAILVVLDEEGRIRHWNRPAERAFGSSEGQVVGRCFEELTLPFAGAPLLEAVSACLTGRHEQRLDDLLYTRAEGGAGFLGVTISPMLDGAGRLQGCLLLGRDVTERRELEAQLARAQKLESLGQLAAGIAHEINTPVQFVSDNTTFLESSLEELRPLLEAAERLRLARLEASGAEERVGELIAAAGRVDLTYTLAELPRAIDDSLGGLERIAGIVRAMKDFSHPGSGHKEPTDVNRCIHSTTTVARNEWKYVATLELELDPALPHVPCHAQDLNQVLLNMIVNAAHAIQEQRSRSGSEELGRITIGTRIAGDELEIRVADTGCGIPATVRGRVFDPFFTTKPVGKGTGQGLAIVHNVVVQKHGGRIELESEVGAGTTFRIYLPLAEGRPTQAREAQEALAA